MLLTTRTLRLILGLFFALFLITVAASARYTVDYCNKYYSTNTCPWDHSPIHSSSSLATAAFQTSRNNNSSRLQHSKRNNFFYSTVMRAWSCHGRDQIDLVERLVSAGIVRSDKVRDVLMQVDRQQYVPFQNPQPYVDAPQVIGYGQTISAPHMHAHVLEEMLPSVDKNDADNEVTILDVGSGSGYLTAVFGRWVAPGVGDKDKSLPPILGRTGHVYGIDVVPKLVEFSRSNIEKRDGDLLETGIITLQVGNGWEGLPEKSPYDIIHVGAAASDFPIPLLQQLKVGGVLIIPVGPQGDVQNLYKVERLKESSKFHQEDYRMTKLLGVRYVPLVNPKDNS